MKRLFSALLVLILLVCTFTGCKKESTDSAPTTGAIQATDPTQNGSQNTTPDTPEVPDPTIIVDFSPVNPNGLALEENGITYNSLAQKALVKTAMAYWARKTRIQYDDTRLIDPNAPGSALYRWQSGVRKYPEEYTTQYPGYLNCAAFIRDVFIASLNLDIRVSYTGHLAAIDDERRVFQYIPTGKETDEEKAAVEKQFYDTLQMGDIVVTRAAGNSVNGHATLYVGKPIMLLAENVADADAENYIYDCIHSSGQSYSYDKLSEKAEKNGTVEKTSTRHIFNTTSGKYLFTKCQSLTIIRPLNTFTGDVPQNSLNRMLNMENVVAEKLSSHAAGMTVNPGGNITYTFSITNNNTTPVTLGVGDLIPENTTFVSAENHTLDGNKITWIVTVPAGETATVSYTVKVGEDVKPGQYIESVGASVGNIAVKCPNIYVGNTLTDEQQATLSTAMKNLPDSDKKGMALANAIYSNLEGYENLLTDDAATLLGKLFRADNAYSYLSGDSSIAPGLFGGRYVLQRDKAATDTQQYCRYENRRTRMLRTDELMVGDILVASTTPYFKNYKVYMYTGEVLLDLSNGVLLSSEDTNIHLTRVLAYAQFAVLRPSLMLDSKQ